MHTLLEFIFFTSSFLNSSLPDTQYLYLLAAVFQFMFDHGSKIFDRSEKDLRTAGKRSSAGRRKFTGHYKKLNINRKRNSFQSYFYEHRPA
mgnify:CR=1 FL=1